MLAQLVNIEACHFGKPVVHFKRLHGTPNCQRQRNTGEQVGSIKQEHIFLRKGFNQMSEFPFMGVRSAIQWRQNQLAYNFTLLNSVEAFNKVLTGDEKSTIGRRGIHGLCKLGRP